MSKQGNKARRRQRRNAARDVRIMQQPAYNEIDRAEQQSQADYLNELQGYRSAFGGFDKAMSGIQPIHGEAIMGRLNDQLSTLQGLMSGGGVDMSTYGLPVGMPSEEVSAGQNLGASLGAGAMGDIASMMGRDQAWQRSAERSGALGAKYAKENLAQSLEDTLRGYSDQRIGLGEQAAPMIKSRMNELRQQQFENQALRQKMEQDRAFAEYFIGSMEDEANRLGRRRRRRNRREDRNNRGHNDNNDSYTPSANNEPLPGVTGSQNAVDYGPSITSMSGLSSPSSGYYGAVDIAENAADPSWASPAQSWFQELLDSINWW